MFRFNNFALHHEKSSLKIGTDSVLLACLADITSCTHILDIGCGCGVIALGLADRLQTSLKNAKICGIDIDADSIAEANLNHSIFPDNEHIFITFQQAALQIHYPNEPYDLIVSNPPYFSSSLKPSDQRRMVSKHQDNNLSFADLACHAARLLSPAGTFWLILPMTEYVNFCTEGAQQQLYPFREWRISPNPRKASNRIVAAFTKSNAAVKVESTTLMIRDELNRYTADYKATVAAIQNLE
ncbi:MAG: methyltransferase [Bacteroidales bacterium]|jgi:tRNA1Val (adenine37-N6)-methyltransferase|nr:methyltransferase [Bacteroidales bacterium]